MFLNQNNDVKVKAIRPGDPLFVIKGTFTYTPRAGFELSKNIPNTYREVVEECVNRGWLTPIAHMRDDEYVWESLKE